MCEYYDASWKIVLTLLLLFSILTILLRMKFGNRAAGTNALPQPQWLAALVFWGAGFVGITMLALMILGFACAGSPGDIDGIVPN